MVQALIVFIATLLVTPYIAMLAEWVGAVDRPNERRIHRGIVSNWGGVGLSLCTAPFVPLAGICVAVAGAIDGVKPVDYRIKLGCQILAAAWVAYLFDTGWPLVSIAWICLMTNSMNLIDGVDGLATGTGILILLGVALLSPASSFMAMVMVAALLGFWWWNWYPASVFLGDSGSYLIGFMIGYLTLNLPWTVRIALCAYPIADVALAFWRRGWNWAQPDKRHIHHWLLNINSGNQPVTVSRLYGWGLVSTWLALLI